MADTVVRAKEESGHTTMNEHETFEALHSRLLAEGWQRGYPPRRGLVNGAAIDHAVCAEATCEACGHVGLTYVSYVDAERRISESGYCAVCTCPRCQGAYEF